jgi:hypothetical protein
MCPKDTQGAGVNVHINASICFPEPEVSCSAKTETELIAATVWGRIATHSDDLSNTHILQVAEVIRIDTGSNPGRIRSHQVALH